MQCAEYKAKTLVKYETDKAEKNGADAYDAVEVAKNKRKVKGAVGESSINYNFQNNGWSSE